MARPRSRQKLPVPTDEDIVNAVASGLEIVALAPRIKDQLLFINMMSRNRQSILFCLEPIICGGYCKTHFQPTAAAVPQPLGQLTLLHRLMDLFRDPLTKAIRHCCARCQYPQKSTLGSFFMTLYYTSTSRDIASIRLPLTTPDLCHSNTGRGIIALGVAPQEWSPVQL